MKEGQNQPCPCGSGKKYKKCCGRQAKSETSMRLRPKINVVEMFQIAMQHHQTGQFENEAAIYREILSVDDSHAEALHNLGMFAYSKKNNERAFNLVKKAVSIKPDVALFHDSLGRVFFSQRRLNEAADCFRRALALKSDFGEAYCNLGITLQNLDCLYESMEYLKKSLVLNPANLPAHNSMALTLLSLGLVDEAIEWYRKALDLEPQYKVANENLLLALNYSLHCSPEEIFEAHVHYSKLHANVSRSGDSYPEYSRDRERTLRIGYMSPDFRAHSVASFIEPVIEGHDRNHFEIFAYYNNHLSDNVTKRVAQKCDHWRAIAAMSDTGVAELIGNDKIDILVDLTGYTANNRLLLFSRKLAPLQVAWIGYPGSTGLAEMDYRITDDYADPVGLTERFHTEKLLRLPDCFSCFSAPSEAPAVAKLPAEKNGYITFGSFNNLAKMNADVIELWAKVLAEVPASRLMLKYRGLAEVSTRKMIQNAFSKVGISEKRLILLGQDSLQKDHLQRYNEIDIALDPFPYCGTTTTCDALWMGVPVITLEGEAHVSRVGVSQLSNLGFKEWIASDKGQYIAIARALSSDVEHLAEVRSILRKKMAASPLMDATRLVGHLESLFRKIWTVWCAR